MQIEIDPSSGFCYGVVNAIKVAEKHLLQSTPLFCLGEIVHNDAEIDRLKKIGLQSISHADMKNADIKKILIRAHGEPPSSYKTAHQNGIEIIDATCPVVLKLQQRIRESYLQAKPNNKQIVIYGQKGHAEVNGLVGQTEGKAIVVEKTDDIKTIDFSKPVIIFSQTTKNIEDFFEIVNEIKKRTTLPVEVHDTICRQVSGRIPKLKIFAQNYDLIIFVGGKKSSNAKVLFEMIAEVNSNSFFIASPNELKNEWFVNIDKVGICGATSTPMWIMEQVAKEINAITNN